MLLSLHVKNLALIEEEEVVFTDGLNIMTGETGAGKSVIIGSVNLALGAKADKSLIRTGAEYALVELVFRPDTQQQTEKLKEMDLPLEDDGSILIKRKIYPGRSVCQAGGESVTTKQLREASSCLIDVYGQRDNHALLKREAQLSLIDEYAGTPADEVKQKLEEVYDRYVKLRDEWENGGLNAAERARETDLLSYEIREIEEASLKAGEDEELEKEYRKLSNFRRISEAAGGAYSLADGESSAASMVDRALRGLLQVGGLDEKLDEVTAQLSDIDALLSDFGRTLSDYMEELAFDPARLEEIEGRLNLINRLKEKYGRSIADIEKEKAKKQERLDALLDYETTRAKLKKQLDKTHADLLSLCERLSGIRKEAADDLLGKLSGALLDLNFQQADLAADLVSSPEHIGRNGYDAVTLMISVNPGEERRPLDEIASGGELSRIMLGLKTVFAGKDDIHSFIFDEIDSGISGQTAWKVAEKMGMLSRDHQILCITHLPQIAAMADSHFGIMKSVRDGRTVTHIQRLKEEESVRELARLLGTADITDTTLENARDLHRQAGRVKKSFDR